MNILSNPIPALNSCPSLRTELCLNRLQRRTPCTRCADICPHGVFPIKPGEAVDWSRCTDCSLCVAACPTRALTVSEPVRRIYTEAASEKGPLRVSCRREEEHGEMRVGCLASIPWELLAAFALRGQLCLYIRACDECPLPKQKALVNENLAALKAFLGAERFEKQVRLNDAAQAIRTVQGQESEKPMTRRALFSGMRRGVKQQLFKEAEKRLPLLSGQREDSLALRLTLAEAVKADRVQNPEMHYGVLLPRYNFNCFGCGICETVCPHMAISVMAEKGGTRLMYIEPKKCTACGLCASLCPHKGMDGLETVMVPHMEKLPLVRIKSDSCENCGAVLLPGTQPKLCRRCIQKTKSTRIK